MPSNEEFINAIFGPNAAFCHVTSFDCDPSNIPKNQHLMAWKGDYYSRYNFEKMSNQYFTISTFHADDNQTARRRKSLYKQTHCIVLDDVKEKLSMVEVEKLPPPTWVLETSPGSEQWGYLLSSPCADRHRVENLLDGLVANGLAPEGRDPGMKGVTRYVRLPDGYNTKAGKMIEGKPFKCVMTTWQPFNTVTLEQLAAPFHVDLDATRRESRVDGAARVDDHPLLDLHDIVHIKEVRSDGRFDITCPWVDEHTGGDDSGSAIFTNSDGTIGFKCHHGNCQDLTGKDLLQLIEKKSPGFKERLSYWQVMRALPVVETSPTAPVNTTAPLVVEQGYDQLLNMLRLSPKHTSQGRELAGQILKVVDAIPTIERVHIHDIVRDEMSWTKSEFKSIISDLREEWYTSSKAEVNFFDDVVFIAEQNQFFDRKKRIFFTTEAYQNTYAHLDGEARKSALQGGLVTKVDRIDYAPLMPAIFEEDGILYGNSWSNTNEPTGEQGDVSRWLEHFKVMGLEKEMDHLIKWMAFTIRHPDIKINHMIILGGAEGIGKDWLLYPLVKAMGEHHMTIDGEELLSSFDDYKLASKHLHINEVELGDHKEATKIANKLKPLATAPPFRLRVNQKGIKPIRVRNILSVSMTTNSQRPLSLNGTSRRIFATWSDLNMRDDNKNMLPEWSEYWDSQWSWMKGEGWKACLWHMKNTVDLSDFSPGSAPPVTDFLRDIIDSSKSPLQQTIESLIRESVNEFACDVMSASQITGAIRCAVSNFAGLICVDARYITPSRVDQVMGTMRQVKKVKCSHGRVWVIRNSDRYCNMTSDQVYEEHLRQSQLYKSKVMLTVVGN